MVLDSGNFCTIGEHLWQVSSPNLFLSAANSRYMGTCLPMAIGASIFDRSVPTAAVLGDGGIGMYISELKIAAERKLPLLIILLSDGGYGSIRTRAVKDNLDQGSLTFSNPSWLEIVKGFGLEAYRASGIEEFSTNLSNWDNKEGPYFIECNFNPSKYQEMTRDLR